MIDRVERGVEMVGRHFDVLQRVLAEASIGIVNLADELGYPKHKIRYSLLVLEEASVIEPTSSGAVPTDRAAGVVEDHGERIDDVIDQLEAIEPGEPYE